MLKKDVSTLKVLEVKKKNQLAYLKGYEIEYETKSGKVAKWELVSRGSIDRLKDEIFSGAIYSDGAMIFATDKLKTKVVVLKEFRVSAGKYVYTLPAGLMDPDEDIELTSKREFKEETGLEFEYISSSPSRYVSVGIVNERINIAFGYYSGEISKKYQSDEEDAEIIFVDKELAADLLANEDVTIRSALLLEYFFQLNNFFEK